MTYSRISKLVNPTNLIAASLVGDYRIGLCMYEPLYQNKGGAITGLLAEKTEYSADRLTMTITLKSGVKFHDGTDFDAPAVKANIDLRKASTTFLSRSALAPVKEVRVVNPKTVQILLSSTSGSLQALLAAPGFGMQSPTAMAKFPDPVQYAQNAAGTGAFKPVGGPTPEGGMTLVRNDQYWGPKAYLDQLVYKPIVDASARAVALEAGDINAGDFNPEDVPRLQSQGFNVQVASPNGSTALWFNLAKPPFNDKRARQAVAYSLDGDSVEKLGHQASVRARSVLLSVMPGYSAQPPYAYDVARAKQLFTDAGLRPGTPLNFLVHSTYPTLSQLIKQNLDAIGFNATIRVLPSVAWNAEMDKGAADATWQLSLEGVPNAYPDADGVLPRFFASASDRPGGGNWPHYRNDSFDDLLAKESAESDPAARNAILAQVQQLLWNDLPILPLLHNSDAVGSGKSVHDLDVSHADGFVRFQRAWIG